MGFFRFSTKKAIQAAGVLLGLTGGRRMEYLRLIKLLYIADRQHLQQHRRPIVGRRLVAMQNGPLHSDIYDLVKGEHLDEPLWSEHIRQDGYEVELVKDAGVSELSAAEVRTLRETSDRHENSSEWELVELTHEFAEWRKNYPDKSEKTSRTIPFGDLLDAIGLADEKPAILSDLLETAHINQLFPCS